MNGDAEVHGAEKFTPEELERFTQMRQGLLSKIKRACEESDFRDAYIEQLSKQIEMCQESPEEMEWRLSMLLPGAHTAPGLGIGTKPGRLPAGKGTKVGAQAIAISYGQLGSQSVMDNAEDGAGIIGSINQIYTSC